MRNIVGGDFANLVKFHLPQKDVVNSNAVGGYHLVIQNLFGALKEVRVFLSRHVEKVNNMLGNRFNALVDRQIFQFVIVNISYLALFNGKRAEGERFRHKEVADIVVQKILKRFQKLKTVLNCDVFKVLLFTLGDEFVKHLLTRNEVFSVKFSRHRCECGCERLIVTKRRQHLIDIIGKKLARR